MKPTAWRLRGSIVAVMQAAESGLCRHESTTHGAGSSGRRLLVEPEVRSVLMIVAHIIAEESLQVEIVQGDDVVQKVPPATLNPSLRDSVLPRTLERGPNRAYGHRPYCDWNFEAILGVPIKNQKSGS